METPRKTHPMISRCRRLGHCPQPGRRRLAGWLAAGTCATTTLATLLAAPLNKRRRLPRR